MGEGDHSTPRGRGAAPPTGFPEAFTNCVRGMMLGLLLGDVRNAGEIQLQSGSASHQLCWVLDALIRFRLRARAMEQTGECPAAADPPAPTEHIREGLLRWGALNRGWPRQDLLDGWLVDVPALAADPGPTPVEDRAYADLAAGRPLSSCDSFSASAMIRALPIAASSVVAGPDLMAGWCATAAGLTHGHPEAWSTAAMLGVLTGGHLAEVFRSGPWARLDPLVSARWLVRGLPGHPLLDRLMPALADSQGWSAATLAQISPDDAAASVLSGALYLFRHCRLARPAEVRERAASAGAPSAVAALTGALIGLEQGPHWLDVGELSRHELAWPMDALARDYCLTLWSPPAYAGEMDVLDEMGRRYPCRAAR